MALWLCLSQFSLSKFSPSQPTRKFCASFSAYYSNVFLCVISLIVLFSSVRLRPFRFQALEEEFSFQLEEQERHYGRYLKNAIAADEVVGASGGVGVASSSTSLLHPRSSTSSRGSGSKSSGGSSERSLDAPRRMSSSSRHNLTAASEHHHHHHHR